MSPISDDGRLSTSMSMVQVTQQSEFRGLGLLVKNLSQVPRNMGIVNP